MDNESIRNIVMLELIAPEDPSKRLISEDEGRALHSRYTEPRACTDAPRNWNYVFEPIKDEKTRQRFIELFEELDKQ